MQQPTLAEMRSLCGKVREAKKTSGRTSSWEVETVEVIRRLAEVVIFGERSFDEAYFEIFAVENTMATLVSLAVSASAHPTVQTQVLQTISILVQNLQVPQSLYAVLSSNHVNGLVERGDSFSNDEETQATFVSFLKTLSLRLDSDTVQFFLDNRAESFALHDAALSYIDRREPMARASALTTLLNIYAIDDPHARRFVSREETRRAFADKFVAVVSSEVDGLANAIGNEKESAVDARCGQLEDLLDYAHDVLSLDMLVSEFFEAEFLKGLVDRKLLAALDDADASPPTATAAALTATLLFRSGASKRTSQQSARSRLLRRSFESLVRPIVHKGLCGGDIGYEPLISSALLALDAGRRNAGDDACKQFGLERRRTAARKPLGAKPESATRVKSLLEDLVLASDDETMTATRKQLFSDDDDDDPFSEVDAEEFGGGKESCLAREARKHIVACLDRYDDYRVGTLRLAAATLATLRGTEEDEAVSRASLKTSVSGAATNILADLDDANMDSFFDQLGHFVIRRERKRPSISTQFPKPDDSDDDDDDDEWSSAPLASSVGFGQAIFGGKTSYVQAFLVLCDALDPSLAPNLAEDLDDSERLTVDTEASAVLEDLAGRKCLTCAVLRARPRKQSTTPTQLNSSSPLSALLCRDDSTPDTKRSVALDWLDLYLVLDDHRLLLAVPDPLALSSGRVLSSAPMHSVKPADALDAGNNNASKHLDLLVASRYPVGLAVLLHEQPATPGKHSSSSTTPSKRGVGGRVSISSRHSHAAPDEQHRRQLYRLSLVFEDEKSNRLAHTFVRSRREAMRERRQDDLRNTLARLVEDANFTAT